MKRDDTMRMAAAAGLTERGAAGREALGREVAGRLRGGRRFLGVAALLLAVACTPVYRNHGYVPAPDELARIKIGSSREEVATAIGRPSAQGLLNDDGWYYVQSRWESYGARAPKEVDRQVVAVSFDKAGRVQNIEHFGLDRGRVVALSRRVTTPSVKAPGIMRQLFANIGRLSAGQFIDSDTQ